MLPQFASSRLFLDPVDYRIEVLSGEGNLPAGSINLYCQQANRVGLNLPSDRTTINYNAGDAIAITFNSTAIKSGEDVHYLVVSAETTGDAVDAVLIAAISMREADGVTLKSLQVTITLAEPEHLNLNRLYPDEASLPSGNNLLNGAIAQLNGIAQNYLYDATTGAGDITAGGGTGYWSKTYLPLFTYIANPEATGCDRILPNTVTGEYKNAPLRPYGQDSKPIRYWIYNETPENNGQSILAGTSFAFEFSIDDRRGESIKLAGCVSFKVVGLARKATGILYTDIDGANITVDWHPGTGNILTTQVDILPGYALVVDIWFNSNSDRLLSRGIVKANEIIRLEDIYELGAIGVKSDLWDLTGNVVLPGGDLLRVVPNQVLTGKALIEGYSVLTYQPQPIIGLQNDTANQIIALSASRGGDVTVYQDVTELDDTEAIRAFVSTVGSFSNASEFSNEFTLNTQGAISLTITLPYVGNQLAIIRADYPDERIRNLKAHWHNPKLRLYLIHDSTLYYRTQLIDSESQANQTIVIDDLAQFNPTPAIPTQSDRYYGLFSYGRLITADGGTGNLPVGTYQIAVAYETPTPNSYITSINHSEALGAMPEKTDIFDRDLSYWKNTKLTVNQLRSLLNKDVKAGFIYGVYVNKKYVPFVFDPTVVASDNGISVLKPTFLRGSPGAFVPLPTLGHRFINSSGLLPARHQIRVQGKGVTVIDSPAANETTITIPAVPVTVMAIDPNLIWHDGTLLELSDGTLL